MSEYYPPPAFYFSVNLMGLGLVGIDASFQEVSGLQVQFETEKVNEGGENRFSHILPSRGKYSNLVLKRGYVVLGSALAVWAGLTIGSTMTVPVVPMDLLVSLLNEDGLPRSAWRFVNAYPLRWEISPMNSQENKILTETFELSYNYYQRML